MQIDWIATGCALAGYILRQIDLKRIKNGKKPLFDFINLVKVK